MELETMQGPEDEEEEILLVKKFETKSMADGFGFIKNALAIFRNQDPNVERFSKVAISVRDFFQFIALSMMKRKKRQCKLP